MFMPGAAHWTNTTSNSARNCGVIRACTADINCRSCADSRNFACRCRSLSSARVPSGSRWARIRFPTIVTPAGLRVRAASASMASALARASGSTEVGILSITSSITATCVSPIAPSATAAAVAGNFGSRRSPVMAVNRPIEAATTRRRRDSPSPIRSPWVSSWCTVL